MPSEERADDGGKRCPKCGGEMLPCIDKDHPLMRDSTYHFSGHHHCMKCGHEEKVR